MLSTVQLTAQVVTHMVDPCGFTNAELSLHPANKASVNDCLPFAHLGDMPRSPTSRTCHMLICRTDVQQLITALKHATLCW